MAQLELPGWPPDFEHPYLTKQLIPYIGNKRALLGRLAEVFRRLAGGSPGPEQRFLDPFAGSGAVARLSRYLGFGVLAGDWEFYAYVLNFAHLCVGRGEAGRLFRSSGGLERVIEELNGLPSLPEPEGYVARHYAPADTATADYRVERLFYTRENALRIDAVRSRIEELYPGFDLEGNRRKEKFLLLAALLYQSATHTNTSGVFKAFHKGFGGHGRDALRRIMAPIRLQVPELVDGPPAVVEFTEATELARGCPVELCYLDPPYNQHQYGSNYHLLNTIALWDRPPVSGALGPDGRLLHKAGIRPDWVRTRSPYCYRASALEAFRGLLAAVDARWIVLSYNHGGIVPFEELVELLAPQGRLSLEASDYTVYRGGRQSIFRQVHTQELLLVLERGRRAPSDGHSQLRRAATLGRLLLLLRGSFDPRRIAAAFPLCGRGIVVTLGGLGRELPMWREHRFSPQARDVLEEAARSSRVTEGELGCLERALEGCRFPDLGEEVEFLIRTLLDGAADLPLGRRENEELQRRVLTLLRKYAHRKYRRRFEATVQRLRLLLQDAGKGSGEWSVLRRGLPRIETQARARFEG